VIVLQAVIPADSAFRRNLAPESTAAGPVPLKRLYFFSRQANCAFLAYSCRLPAGRTGVPSGGLKKDSEGLKFPTSYAVSYPVSSFEKDPFAGS
jgi:hypothetical protein